MDVAFEGGGGLGMGFTPSWLMGWFRPLLHAVTLV